MRILKRAHLHHARPISRRDLSRQRGGAALLNKRIIGRRFCSGPPGSVDVTIVRSCRALLLSIGLLATVSACDERDARTAFQVMPASDRVNLGPLDEYRELGVYTQHAPSHGVFLVHTQSRPDARESTLFALRRACPHDGHRLQYDSLSNRFDCPRGGHRYTVEGLPTTPGYQGPAMVRVAVMEKNGNLVIAPDRRFYFQKQQWSLEHSMLVLEND